MVNAIFQQLVFGHSVAESCETSKDWGTVAKIEEQELKLAEAQNDVLSLLQTRNENVERIRAETNAAFALASSTMVSDYVLSYPFVQTKWRMMLARATARSMARSLVQVVDDRGVLGLWSGLPSVFGHAVAVSATSFLVNSLTARLKWSRKGRESKSRSSAVSRWWKHGLWISAKFTVHTLTFPVRHWQSYLLPLGMPLPPALPFRQRFLSVGLRSRTLSPRMPDLVVSSAFFLLDSFVLLAYRWVRPYVRRRIFTNPQHGGAAASSSSSPSKLLQNADGSAEQAQETAVPEESEAPTPGILASSFPMICTDAIAGMTAHVLLHPLELVLARCLLSGPSMSTDWRTAVRQTISALFSPQTYRGLDGLILAELAAGWLCLESSYFVWRWASRRIEAKFDPAEERTESMSPLV
ncbi:hypothetical protein RI367_003082 [Sorochytrium milnesiophthora]